MRRRRRIKRGAGEGECADLERRSQQAAEKRVKIKTKE